MKYAAKILVLALLLSAGLHPAAPAGKIAGCHQHRHMPQPSSADCCVAGHPGAMLERAIVVVPPAVAGPLAIEAAVSDSSSLDQGTRLRSLRVDVFPPGIRPLRV